MLLTLPAVPYQIALYSTCMCTANSELENCGLPFLKQCLSTVYQKRITVRLPQSKEAGELLDQELGKVSLPGTGRPTQYQHGIGLIDVSEGTDK